jgi:hypothetical protein
MKSLKAYISMPSTIVFALVLSVFVIISTGLQAHATTYNTLSGTLTDGSGSPMVGVTVRLSTGTTTPVTSVTDSSGYYSITEPAGVYVLSLSGTYMDGMNSFSLSQSGSNPGVNLNYGNVTQDLQLPTTDLTVTAYNNAGQGNYSANVIARTTSGTTVLYPGDTGMSMNVTSTGFSTSSSPTSTIGTIVGAVYNANGLETTTTTSSICESIYASPSLYDCLTNSFYVTGSMSVGVPSTLPITRVFQGTLTDGSGTPIPNVQVELVKYADSSTYATTDSNGYFRINLAPKAYSLKLIGDSSSGLAVVSFTLTQSVASPSINLVTSNLPQDLQIQTATVTVNANDSSGNPNYFTTVNAKATAGTAYLYSSDPGFSINIYSNGFATTSSNTGTIQSIVGATYTALGLGVSNPSGSICDRDGLLWDCLTTAYTVSGPATINTPF